MNSIKFEQDELFPLRFLNEMRVESRTTHNVTIVTRVDAFVAHKKDIYCIVCYSLNTSAFTLKYLGYTATSVICGTWNKLHNYLGLEAITSRQFKKIEQETNSEKQHLEPLRFK